MGGSSGGKGGGGTPKNQFADEIGDYMRRTQPLQRQLKRRYKNFLSPDGSFDVTQMPTYWPMRNQVEDQYGVAQDQAIAQGAPGGGMDRNLTNLSQGRARAIGDISGNLAQDEYNKALQFTMGPINPTAALASSQMQSNAMMGAGQAGAMGNLGSGLGMMIGMGKGRPKTTNTTTDNSGGKFGKGGSTGSAGYTSGSEALGGYTAAGGEWGWGS